MAFSTASSRFSLLTDDASDPFAKKSKAKTQNSTSGTGTGNGKSGSSTTAQKKAKDKKSTPGTNTTNNKGPNNGASNGSGDSSTGKSKHQNKSNVDNSNKPKPKPKAAALEWEAWEKRDAEYVTLEYQSQLEEAILQSKLEFQKQQQQILQGIGGTATTSSTTKPKKKKKSAAVPIAEFNQAVSGAIDSNANRPVSDSVPVDEESIIQRLRLETQMELLKDKQHAEEKALLLSRNAHFVNGNINSKVISETTNAALECMDDRDLRSVICQLEKDKQGLEEELDVFKARFKKLLGLLNDSELKEKVHLQRDLEKMTESNQELTKLNQDLNDELKNAYSQLEQERSRSHAALMEVKKMSEQSRRTHGRTHSQHDLFQ